MIYCSSFPHIQSCGCLQHQIQLCVLKVRLIRCSQMWVSINRLHVIRMIFEGTVVSFNWLLGCLLHQCDLLCVCFKCNAMLSHDLRNMLFLCLHRSREKKSFYVNNSSFVDRNYLQRLFLLIHPLLLCCMYICMHVCVDMCIHIYMYI